MSSQHESNKSEMEQFVERVGPFFDKWGNHVTAGICILAVVIAAFVYFGRSSHSAAVRGWTEFSKCTTAGEFGNLADKEENTELGAWARVSQADRLLDDGIKSLFSSRTSADRLLKSAEENYRDVLNNNKAPRVARERALYGLARTLEATSEGDNQPAIDAYKRLLDEFGNSVYESVVDERLTDLQSGESKEFYAWFDRKDPEIPDRTTPDQPSIQLPGIPADLQFRDDLNNEPSTAPATDDGGTTAPAFPDENSGEDSSSESSATETPETEQPAETETAPELPAP